jgi:hypothetical protein
MRFIKLYKRQPSGEKVLWALFLYRGYKFRGYTSHYPVVLSRFGGLSGGQGEVGEKNKRGNVRENVLCFHSI